VGARRRPWLGSNRRRRPAPSQHVSFAARHIAIGRGGLHCRFPLADPPRPPPRRSHRLRRKPFPRRGRATELEGRRWAGGSVPVPCLCGAVRFCVSAVIAGGHACGAVEKRRASANRLTDRLYCLMFYQSKRDITRNEPGKIFTARLRTHQL
jgi:hypothetical protein